MKGIKMKQKFPVDLVYLWCDGSDPEFQKRKEVALKKEHKEQNRQAVTEGRFIQIDELKYSLRSVEKYMPWIHHIFIVTDRQVPPWLNQENRKITVVDHSEILPKSAIPTFNSNVIEGALYKIKNLSEHFLYANDDTFVNRRLKPSFFFNCFGKIIIRGKYRTFHPDKSQYDQRLLNVQSMIQKAFGKSYTFEPHHNIDAYLKSDFQACAEYFRDEFEKTTYHTFRQSNSVQRLIVHLFSLVRKTAVFKNICPKWYQLKFHHLKRFKTSSMYIDNNQLFFKLKKQFYRYNPALFCLNDNEYSTHEDRIVAKKFLESYFPHKSQFEK